MFLQTRVLMHEVSGETLPDTVLYARSHR